MDAINDGKMTVLQTFLFRLLSVYYNVKIGLYLLCSVLGFDPSILSVKERKEKPAVLTEGVSDKFVQINVSKWMVRVKSGTFANHGPPYRD